MFRVRISSNFKGLNFISILRFRVQGIFVAQSKNIINIRKVDFKEHSRSESQQMFRDSTKTRNIQHPNHTGGAFRRSIRCPNPPAHSIPSTSHRETKTATHEPRLTASNLIHLRGNELRALRLPAWLNLDCVTLMKLIKLDLVRRFNSPSGKPSGGG